VTDFERAAKNGGNAFWEIELANGELVRLRADRFRLAEGCLVFEKRLPELQSYESTMAWAPGSWRSVLAVSCLDGTPVAVASWVKGA
jgi:hypothetical protein